MIPKRDAVVAALALLIQAALVFPLMAYFGRHLPPVTFGIAFFGAFLLISVALAVWKQRLQEHRVAPRGRRRRRRTRGNHDTR